MKLKHYDGDGRARFVTFCTAKRLPLLTNKQFRLLVIKAIDSMRRQFRFKLLGYVIMPNHIHLVIVPPEDSELGRIIGEIKRDSAVHIINLMKSYNSPILRKLQVVRDGRQKHAFWMRRCYDYSCRSPEDVWEKVRYCHANPVRSGLVKDPARWEWSSYRWYYGLEKPLLEIDSAG